MCLRCCSILSRAFLHHLQALTSLPGFGKLWLDTVTLLSQNLEGVSAAGDAGGVAAESCQQILTNMVMVVAYAGLLGGHGVVGDTGETAGTSEHGAKSVHQEAAPLSLLADKNWKVSEARRRCPSLCKMAREKCLAVAFSYWRT